MTAKCEECGGSGRVLVDNLPYPVTEHCLKCLVRRLEDQNESLQQQVNTLRDSFERMRETYEQEREFSGKFQKERDALVVQVNTLTEALEWYANTSIWITTEMEEVYAIEPLEYVGEGPWIKARAALQSIKEQKP